MLIIVFALIFLVTVCFFVSYYEVLSYDVVNGIPDSEPTFRTNVRVYTYDEALSYKLGYENYPDYRGVPKVEIRMRLF